MYKSTTKKRALVHAFFVTGNLLFVYLQLPSYMYCSRAGLLLIHEGVYQPIGIVWLLKNVR